MLLKGVQFPFSLLPLFHWSPLVFALQRWTVCFQDSTKRILAIWVTWVCVTSGREFAVRTSVSKFYSLTYWVPKDCFMYSRDCANSRDCCKYLQWLTLCNSRRKIISTHFLISWRKSCWEPSDTALFEQSWQGWVFSHSVHSFLGSVLITESCINCIQHNQYSSILNLHKLSLLDQNIVKTTCKVVTVKWHWHVHSNV